MDRWFVLFNALALAAWAPFLRVPAARWGMATHALALPLPFLLARAGARPARWLRELYPILFVGVFWTVLGFRGGALDTARNDALVATLDRALFGGHPNLLWIAAMPWPPLVAVMEAFYFAYYALLVGVPLLLLARGDRMGMRELMLRVAVTYFLCFLIYLVFPVLGPLEMFPRFTGATFTDPFHRLNEALRAGGDSLGTAFPSSHVAGAVTLAWVAWRRLPRAWAWAAVVTTVLMTVATVYTQHHFAVDALAGVALAVGLQALVVPRLGCPSTRSHCEAAPPPKQSS